MQEIQELYRGALYDPSKAQHSTVTPDPRLNNPLYRDKNGYPIMFPGAAKLRRKMIAERHKLRSNRTNLNQPPKKKSPLTVAQARDVLSNRDFSDKPKDASVNKPKKTERKSVVNPKEQAERLAVLAKFQSKMKGSSLMKPDAVRSNG